MRLLPTTKLGKWALWLSVAFIILITIKIVLWLPLPTFVLAVLGIAGFIVGMIAIIKDEDRAVLIFVSILVGILIILWTVLEFVFPH